MKNKTILLTGASGFLGYHFAKTLLAMGAKVVGIKRKNSSLWRYSDIKSDNLEFYDIENLQKAFSDNTPECVIHTACSYGRNGESLVELMSANVMFGLEVFEMALSHKIQTFFNTDTLLGENINNYALSKKQFSDWLKRNSSSMQIFNMKIEHMYGQKDDNKKFISWFINELINNVDKIDLTSCEQKRDFVFVDDVVNAYLAVFENKEKFGKFAEFDVGTGEQIVLKEFLLEIYNQCKAKFDFDTFLNFGAKEMRIGEAMEVVENVEPLKSLGWKPANNHKDNITMIVDEIGGGDLLAYNFISQLDIKAA